MSPSAPGPTQPPAQCVLGLLPEGLIGQGIILITQLYLMPILRMNGSIPLHPAICLHGVSRQNFTFTFIAIYVMGLIFKNTPFNVTSFYFNFSLIKKIKCVCVIFLCIFFYRWHDDDLLLGQHMKLQCYKTKQKQFALVMKLH